MKIFAENKHKIAKHNQRYERGEVTYRLAPNKYSDMLPHEFVHTMNGFNRTAKWVFLSLYLDYWVNYPSCIQVFKFGLVICLYITYNIIKYNISRFIKLWVGWH